jgi:hypothetical protein
MLNKYIYKILVSLMTYLFCMNIYAIDSSAVTPITGALPPVDDSHMLFQTKGTVSCDGTKVGYKTYNLNPQPAPPNVLSCPSPFKLAVIAIPTTIYQTVELVISSATYDTIHNYIVLSLMCPTVVGTPGNNQESFNIQFICTR